MSANPATERMLDAERNSPAHHTPIPSSLFSVRHLSVLAYANGFTLWHYLARKVPLADVAADGFFSDAADMLAVGDMILVPAADGARVPVVTRSDVDLVATAGCV